MIKYHMLLIRNQMKGFKNFRFENIEKTGIRIK